jgi:hypothetical protein
MALNVALPLAGFGDLLEGFGLLSPISPINTDTIDCRELYKKLISPQGSESSGVSSLDSDDAKVSGRIFFGRPFFSFYCSFKVFAVS